MEELKVSHKNIYFCVIVLITSFVGLAFVNTKYAPESGLWPDIQFHFAPSSVNSDPEQIRKITGLRDSIFNTVYKPLKEAETWTILPLLLRPKSKGWIRLKSKDPNVYPDINPNYFTHKEDILTLAEGIRIALNVSNSKAFQRFNSRPHKLPFPGKTMGRMSSISRILRQECSLFIFRS